MFERGGCLIATLNNDALIAILEIVNRGNKAVVQRKGNGVIVMEEKRKIKYGYASSDGRGQR